MSSNYNEPTNCPPGQILRKGYHRSSYTRRSSNGSRRNSANSTKVKGTYVPERCITSTSYMNLKGKKRSEIDREKLLKRAKIQRDVGEKYPKLKCPPGYIERVGYTRRPYGRAYVGSGTSVNFTHVGSSEVPPTCIIDRGKKGKGQYEPNAHMGQNNVSRRSRSRNRNSRSGSSSIKIPTVLSKGDLKRFGYSNVKNMSVNDRHQALHEAVESYGNPLSIFRKLIVISTMNRNTNPEASKIFHNDAYWLRDQFGLLRTPPRRTASKMSKGRSLRNSTTGRSSMNSTRGRSKSRSKITRVQEY